MTRWRSLWQLFLARIREFFREPEVIFWVYGFPLLLALGLGIAFMSRTPEPPAVDVAAEPPYASDVDALAEHLKNAGIPTEVHDGATCQARYRSGKTALYVVPEGSTFKYVYDPAREESVLARYRVDVVIDRWRAGIESTSAEHSAERPEDAHSWKIGPKTWETVDQFTKEPGNRYIDFLLPGLMGLNLMGGGLWGVGFVLADMRVRKLLKRLLATPMRRGDFLLSILVARMIFLLPEMTMLVLFGWLVFSVPVRGSLFALAIVVVIGAIAFAGIGLLVACRAEKTETVSGLMNLVMLPMWLLSGTFFSSKRFPEAAQPFIQSLPLTQLNDALREVMLEGHGLPSVSWRLAILAGWAAVSFVLAVKWFRWR
jgi:ABC-2 type transport system permease protein